MIENFRNIEYLKKGNTRQQLAYSEIIDLKIFEILKKYNPILVGTIPINIDLSESDLDIICECKNHSIFSKVLVSHFGNKTNFKINTIKLNGITSTIAEFKTTHFIFEIFGQDIPSNKQNAYRHMIVEHQILEKEGDTFRKEIIKLKSKGLKTEPAFAKLLELSGDPYIELLKLEKKGF